MPDMGGPAISLNCVMSKGNYTTLQILHSSTEDAVDKKLFLMHTPSTATHFTSAASKMLMFPRH